MPTHRDQIGRQVLPIPDQQFVGLVTYDAKDPATSFPAIEPLRPPTGAPNVLIVLIDDCGFAGSRAFGGPISCPTAERRTAAGLRFNRFHTTALCSPDETTDVGSDSATPVSDDDGPKDSTFAG